MAPRLDGIRLPPRSRGLRVGVLPGSMAENSGPGDWTATLSLSGDLAGLTGIELLGRDALAFTARLLTGFDALVLTPGAPAAAQPLEDLEGRVALVVAQLVPHQPRPRPGWNRDRYVS